MTLHMRFILGIGAYIYIYMYVIASLNAITAHAIVITPAFSAEWMPLPWI